MGVPLMVGAAILQDVLFHDLSYRTVTPSPFVEALILAPICETLLFQGMIQSLVSKWIGERGAFVATTIVFFAALWALSLPVLAAAVVLCCLRMRARSLGPVMITHTVLNFSMYVWSWSASKTY